MGKPEIPMFFIRGGWSRSSADILGNGEGAKGFTWMVSFCITT